MIILVTLMAITLKLILVEFKRYSRSSLNWVKYTTYNDISPNMDRFLTNFGIQ